LRNPIIDRKGALRPRGEQCFVNYQYVDAGAVAWTAQGKKAPQWGAPPEKVVGSPTGAWGIRLEAQKAQLIGPVIPMERAWEVNYNMYFTAALYEDGLYRAWYSCIPPDHSQQEDVRYKMASGQVLCYATSKDGLHWEKPELGLARYHGEPTNICFGRELSPYGFQSGSLFVDPHGEEAERYKLIYVGLKPVDDLEQAREKYTRLFGDALDPKGFQMLDGKPYVKGLYAAVSPDALHWTCLEEPLLVQPSDTLNTCVWDEERQAYIAYIRLRHGDRRVVGRIESPDFRCWKSAPEIVLKAPLDFSPCDDIYTNNRMDYPGSDVKLMFPNIYHRFTDSRSVYLASSLDDQVWELVPGGAVVEDTGESWCCGDLNPGLGMIPLEGDRMGMPMLGYSRPHKFCRGGEQSLGQPGLAVWKKGRLAALIADAQGYFATPKVHFDGGRLRLNFSTEAAGRVEVELRDDKGQALEGFSFQNCDVLVGDDVGRSVSWGGSDDLSALNGRDIVMAFRLCAAKLYSFEFV